jgi:hypothetical protein
MAGRDDLGSRDRGYRRLPSSNIEIGWMIEAVILSDEKTASTLLGESSLTVRGNPGTKSRT